MKRVTTLLAGILIAMSCFCSPVYAAEVPKENTPDYKVAFMPLTAITCRMNPGKNMGMDMK